MRTDRVVLLTGDYADRLDRIEAAAALAAKAQEKAAKEGGRRLGDSVGGDAVAELAAEYEEVKAEAEANGIIVDLQSVTRREWRGIREKYPPRVGEDVPARDAQVDRGVGVNVVDAEDDVIYHSLVAVTENGKTTRYRDDEGRTVVTLEVFADWADTLSPGDYDKVATAAWDLAVQSRGPKSPPFSLIQRSEQS